MAFNEWLFSTDRAEKRRSRKAFLRGGGGRGKKSAPDLAFFVGLCANLAPKKSLYCPGVPGFASPHGSTSARTAVTTAPTTHAAPRARTARTQRPRREVRQRADGALGRRLRAHTQRDPTDVSRTLVTRVFALSLFRICYLSGPGQFFFPTTTHTLSPKEHQLRMYAGLPRVTSPMVLGCSLSAG
jgi:hypothetical protein